MPRNRSRSGSREKDKDRDRKRDKERERERDRDKHRDRKERDRDRDRHRRRTKSKSRSRSRSKSPRHRSDKRSPSPSHRSKRERLRSPSPLDSYLTLGNLKPKTSASASIKEPIILDPNAFEGKTEEEIEMLKVMGFTGFDSTKGKHIEDSKANAFAVNVQQKRKYRQYMNRKGGFNRPLDPVA